MPKKKVTPKRGYVKSPRTLAISGICDGIEIFDAKQAAAFLEISPDALRKATERQALYPGKIGHRVLYTRADLLRHKERRYEAELTEGFQRGVPPVDLYLEAPGKLRLEDVTAVMHEWARLAGVWLIEGPRGSYARWLQRLGVTSVTPRELRRVIELLLLDSDVCRRSRVHLDTVRQTRERERPPPEQPS